jgi:ribose transport system substrate-binding protein
VTTRTIVVSLLTEEQEFQLMQAEDARQTASRLGVDVHVLFAENNAILQIQQLFRFVHAPEGERPAAIVVETVTGEGLERVARNAVKAGIGWVLLNRSVDYLAELRRERSDLPISLVSVDQQEIGRIQARQFKALLPGGGSLLYVEGPPDTSAARERLQGMEEGIQGSGIQAKILAGDWTETSGEKAVESWLRLKTSEGYRPDVVGAQNDAMAVGARRALLAQRPEWAGVPFTGFDGLPEGGQRLVATGELVATIIGPTTTGPAVQLVVDGLQGPPAPAEVILEPRSFPPESELEPTRRGEAS